MVISRIIFSAGRIKGVGYPESAKDKAAWELYLAEGFKERLNTSAFQKRISKIKTNMKSYEYNYDWLNYNDWRYL